ncbi:hypothetical protein AD941_06975 [Gluconobacter albidus]|uniref:Integrase n=1 Tax=Gluconobacter albidus TaxID=318683 RepID=A0AAW3QWN0_9PROT|nr:hypothetical protein AD941_06975 [Gluconobacter albidus]GBQ93736.1 hypothetical protein AA3250_2899 [Gluconobacter albidus NBRC 3250]
MIVGMARKNKEVIGQSVQKTKSVCRSLLQYRYTSFSPARNSADKVRLRRDGAATWQNKASEFLLVTAQILQTDFQPCNGLRGQAGGTFWVRQAQVRTKIEQAGLDLTDFVFKHSHPGILRHQTAQNSQLGIQFVHSPHRLDPV